MKECEKMPETPAPKMIRIDFSVPTSLHSDAKAIAESEGWKEAELHRIFWERGFAAYAEGSNKRLVNKKLRRDATEREGTNPND